MATPALSLAEVGHAFGSKVALRDVSFDLGEGQILCLLGPSGCGKTTALRVVAGLERPQAGTVRLAGRIVTGPAAFVPPEQRDVGLLFQDYALFPHLSVEDNIAFGLRALPAAERAQRVDELLRRTGMAAQRAAYPHALSGGEQQRVALARALAPRPAVLLLDEPFSSLDTRLRQSVRDETLHVLKDMAASVLLVTHDPEEALFMADRVALMRDGAVLQIGEPADLYFRPQSAFAAEFFGEVNRIPSVVRGGLAASPFGALPAPGFADGTPVLCLVRSEAVHLRFAAVDGALQPQATVEASRLLGRSSLIHLHTHASTGYGLHLHARAPGAVLPAPGTDVWVDLDPRLVFIFAQGPPG